MYILINSGNTYNFMNDKITERLKCLLMFLGSYKCKKKIDKKDLYFKGLLWEKYKMTSLHETS
jgi:hypothetical protein